jgi:uracil-DNA glycosylase
MKNSDWLKNGLGVEFTKPYMQDLSAFLKVRRESSVVYPQKENVFKALELTSFEDTTTVIFGQDPYHNGQANGLSFSINGGPLPPSLKRIYNSLEMEGNGDLSPWAEQGVLMLNTILTVENGLPLSHTKKGWEQFTSKIVQILQQKKVVFVLFGSYAKTQYKKLITNPDCPVIYREHPVAGVYSGKPWAHDFWYDEVNSHLKIPIKWKTTKDQQGTPES